MTASTDFLREGLFFANRDSTFLALASIGESKRSEKHSRV
jgi:hypothetical protein